MRKRMMRRAKILWLAYKSSMLKKVTLGRKEKKENSWILKIGASGT